MNTDKAERLLRTMDGVMCGIGIFGAVGGVVTMATTSSAVTLVVFAILTAVNVAGAVINGRNLARKEGVQ